MAITLHPDQEAWLKTRVASGDFASVEAAARQLLGERIAELAKSEDGASDDETWMKHYIDEGVAALDRGEFVSLEEHKAHNARFAASIPRDLMARVVVSTVAQADTAAILRDLATKAGRDVAPTMLPPSRRSTTDWLSIPVAAHRVRPMGGMSALKSPGLMSWPIAMSPTAILSASFAWFTAAATSRASCLRARRDLPASRPTPKTSPVSLSN